MQQTENLKLNLIETGDPISPAPINENAQKIEAALTSEATARQTADAALDSRVTALELHKIVLGSYSGSSAAQTIELGFTPKFVITQALSYSLGPRLSLCSDLMPDRGNPHFRIIEGGFTVSGDQPYVNSSSNTYIYLAFA